VGFQVLFLFCSYPAVEVSCENVVLMTVKDVYQVWGGGVEGVFEGNMQLFYFRSETFIVVADLYSCDTDGWNEIFFCESPSRCLQEVCLMVFFLGDY